MPCSSPSARFTSSCGAGICTPSPPSAAETYRFSNRHHLQQKLLSQSSARPAVTENKHDGSRQKENQPLMHSTEQTQHLDAPAVQTQSSVPTPDCCPRGDVPGSGQQHSSKQPCIICCDCITECPTRRVHKALIGFLSSPIIIRGKVELPSPLKQDEMFSDGFKEAR